MQRHAKHAHRRLVAGAASVALMVAALTTATPAWAHASMVKSDPPRRAVLAAQPQELRLWFNERIEPAYVSVGLVDEAGNTISTDKGSVALDDPKLVRLALPKLKSGKYVVKYKVMSVDGHTVEWSYSFELRMSPEHP